MWFSNFNNMSIHRWEISYWEYLKLSAYGYPKHGSYLLGLLFCQQWKVGPIGPRATLHFCFFLELPPPVNSVPTGLVLCHWDCIKSLFDLVEELILNQNGLWKLKVTFIPWWGILIVVVGVAAAADVHFCCFYKTFLAKQPYQGSRERSSIPILQREKLRIRDS